MHAPAPRLAAALLAGALSLSACAGRTQPPAFRIDPVRPIEELRREALAATPPAETRPRQHDLVELVALDPSIRLDVRYATTNNFLGSRVYEEARAFLQRPAAEALIRAHGRLRAAGYGILVHDAYRPWYVTKIFWDATPPAHRDFVADPAQGSRHNRGCAVDLTLIELRTGRVVEMPSAYDEFSERAHSTYPGGTADQRRLRDLLRSAMEAEGFTVLENEWWHFDYRDWREYPIGNVRFSEIGRAGQRTGSAWHARGRETGRGDSSDECASVACGVRRLTAVPPGRPTAAVERGTPNAPRVTRHLNPSWMISDLVFTPVAGSAHRAPSTARGADAVGAETANTPSPRRGSTPPPRTR